MIITITIIHAHAATLRNLFNAFERPSPLIQQISLLQIRQDSICLLLHHLTVIILDMNVHIHILIAMDTSIEP